MKGDFSRLTFDPSKAYTGGLMQQGRVQLDSDWNEQVLIAEHLERRRFEDLAGPFTAPGGDGFQVHAAEDGAPALGPGRIYAGGLICALDAETPVPHVARRPLRPRAGKTDLVYLDLWERLVTALDNPNLRDVALEGPDTATRLETAWAIDFVEDVTSPESAAAALPKPASGWSLT